MELGRECMDLWGYQRVDELIWVKTNQLQRLIRTGRTGHWLNHSKEHCLVGVKGQPAINRNLDCDVLVAEVCAPTSRSSLHASLPQGTLVGAATAVQGRAQWCRWAAVRARRQVVRQTHALYAVWYVWCV